MRINADLAKSAVVAARPDRGRRPLGNHHRRHVRRRDDVPGEPPMNADERRLKTKALSAFIRVHRWLSSVFSRLLAVAVAKFEPGAVGAPLSKRPL